jgi:hypothetical protein
MLNPMAIDDQQDLPGAGFDFQDVRNVFEDAAAGSLPDMFQGILLTAH